MRYSKPSSATLPPLLKKFFKAVASRVGVGYHCFKIFMLPLEEAGDAPSLPDGYRFAEVTSNDVAGAADERIRKESWYGGEGALGFGI
jgi:hypothetical protein